MFPTLGHIRLHEHPRTLQNRFTAMAVLIPYTVLS